MLKDSRRNITILIMVIGFFALSFAARGAEKTQTSRKSAKPTPTPVRKNTKAKAAPDKKTRAKTSPIPKKSSTSQRTKSAKKTALNEKIAAAETKKSKNSKNAKNTKKIVPENAAALSETHRKPGIKEKTRAEKTTAKTEASRKKPVSKSRKAFAESDSTEAVSNRRASKLSAAKTTRRIVPKTSDRISSERTEKTSAEPSQIIVTDVAARIRSQAKAGAPEINHPPLGTALQVVEKTPLWYRVKFSDGAKTSTGWIPANSASDFNSAGKPQIYQQITDRYYKPRGMDFATASGLYEFLNRADISELGSTGDLELKRLLALRAALNSVPAGKSRDYPYQNFLKANEKSVVYSEPSGAWIVKSDQFWDLHKKYKDAAVADQIAWEAAQNPLPGECEGYVNCHLFYTRMTSGEYLNLHPNGKHNLEALTNLTNSLEPIVADLSAKSVYTGPTDVTDRAEFNNLVAELRTIVSRLPLTEKEKPLQQLKKIAEGFR